MNVEGKEIKKAYFVGIGGIGMSGLAQLLLDHGVAVSGSDREESPVTELLRSKGIDIVLTQDGSGVPEDADVMVYSEAVWPDNPDRMRAKELGLPELSYFEMLGVVSTGKKTIAVAGTHGKTTTTGMLAKILRDSDASPSAIVGSLVRDFASNYLSGTSELFVVEACEYKRDFLTLTPSVLVITNIEFDHSDYYKGLEDVQSAFRELIAKMPADGVVVTNLEHPGVAPVIAGITQTVVNYTKEEEYELLLPGEFNKQNARAAAAAARVAYPAIENTMIYHSVSEFKGTWRRFEYKGKTTQGADVYDDYAHHPTAIRATLAELRKRTSGKLYVAFHPHLYSRTRDLLDDFAAAFIDADGVFIAPIYAAREVDDGSISSAILAERITANGTPAEAKTFEEIEAALSTYAHEGDIVVTMGAGDIYKVADALVA